MSARLFTPERDELMRRRYPEEGASPALWQALNEMPGPEIPSRQKVADHAKVLRVRVNDISAVIKAGFARGQRAKRAKVVYPMNAPGGPWTPARLDLLRQLWADGLSVLEIGAQLRISKNSVCGKVHRLSLPSRPSPIRKGNAEGGRRAETAKRVQIKQAGQGNTLPPLRAVVSAVVVQLPQPAPLRFVERIRQPDAALLPAYAAYPKRGECQWPFDRISATTWRFCCAPRPGDRIYCDDHQRTAFTKRSEAA